MQNSPCCIKQSEYKVKQKCNVFQFIFEDVGFEQRKEMHSLQLLCSQLVHMPKLTQIYWCDLRN